MVESKKPESKEKMITTGYDRLADRYIEELYHELDNKPFDRELLDQFASRLGPHARICDVGCGPGHIGRYLEGHGATINGVDLSPVMVERARSLNPSIDFSVGNMLALDFEENTFDGMIAFYSIIHVARDEAICALREFARVLRPDAPLLLSFHGGEGEVHVDEMLGEPVPMFATLFSSVEMMGYVEHAGFDAVESVSRPAYDFEYPSERVFVSARR